MSNAASPDVKVVRALEKSSAVQATVNDARTKLEAASWMVFFQLPISQLRRIRDEAIRQNDENVVDDNDELLHAVGFSLQPKNPKQEKEG